MKRLILATLVLGVCAFQASAQEKKEEKRKIRVVIKSDENGKQSLVDTTIDFSELEAKIASIDFDAIIEEFTEDIDGNWKELSEDLQDMDIDIRVNGEKHELEDIEDLAKWIGEAMEGVHFEISDDQENIFVHCNSSDSKSQVRVIVDEDSEDGIFVEEENVSINLDEDGKGSIIIKNRRTNGDNEDVNVWIEEDGNVVVNGGNSSTKAKVKVMKMEDGNLFFSEDDLDNIDVRVITDNSGNSESTVMIKKVVRANEQSFKYAPELPNGLTVQVYPNPNTGEFQLTFRNDKKVKTSVVVYDAKGTEVYRSLIGKVNGLNKKQLSLSHLKSGNYILKLEQGNSSASEQFIIR